MSAAFRVSQSQMLPKLPDTDISLDLPTEDAMFVYKFIDYDEEVDTEISFSFFWSGKTEEPVLISANAYEMPRWSFLVEEADIKPLTAEEMVKEFQLVCNKWIALTLPTLRGVLNAGLEIWL